MTAVSLITMRETLEASLIVGVVLAYLERSDSERFRPVVWLGVLAGVALSLVLAVFFRLSFGGFTGRAEAIYEGVMMLAGSGLITWMILWMLVKRRTIKADIERDTARHVERQAPLGLFFLVFIAVAREGIETVIFLQAALVHSGSAWHMLGGFIGIAIAITLSYFLFKGIMLLSFKHFFSVTSVLLILFAAGLIAHGIHELQEAALLPVVVEHLWDLNPAVAADGSFPLLHEKGAIGSIFRGLFGYNGNPSLLEVVGYVVYLAGISVVWRKMEKGSA